MAKFCTGCGKELADGLMFCTDCGTKATESVSNQADAVKEVISAQAEVIKEPITAQEQPPKHYTPPTQTSQVAENHSASTAHFFWMMLVYFLPLIGWLICIIMAFAPKNESKKHFARAILIWGIVGIIISIIGLIVMSILGGGIAEILSEIY